MIRPRRLVAALAVAILAAAAAVVPSARAQAHDHGTPGHVHAPAPAAPPSAPPAASLVSDRILGSAQAPVTVIEYASFTCPHCAVWTNEVLPEFRTRFIDTGQVRLIYRDLPTNPGEIAVAAAKVTRCAAPDQAFAVIERLMAQQATARSLNYPATWFANAAALGGRPAEEIAACVQDPATQASLETDVQGAQAAGVRGTPTFFINGERFEGVPTVDGLAAVIEPLLAAR